MAKGAVCTHGGEPTRLTCVTCETPICSRCLVETRVGFKCPEHGRIGSVAPPPQQPGQPQQAGKPAKAARPRRGIGFFGLIIVAFLIIPAMTVGLGALFLSTGNDTGFMSVLPLLGFFVLLAVVTVVVARKVLR